MARLFAGFAWLCLIGMLADAAVLVHLTVSGSGFTVPVGAYLASGPDVLSGIGALLDAVLPGPLWRAVQGLPAGPFFAARALTLLTLALVAFAVARASRTRAAGN